MRFLFWILALFAAAIGIALAARYNAGNIVFFYPPYRIDLSLNFFILLEVLLIVAICIALKTLRVTKSMPGRIAAYRREKRIDKANHALREALKYYFGGHFLHAEKAAKRALKLPENAALAALIGAHAAHHMQQPERRDEWLAKVQSESAFIETGLISELELLMDAQQVQKAQKVAEKLHARGACHTHARRLFLKIHQRTGNWQEVLHLLSALDKDKVLDPMLSMQMREQAYENLLCNAVHDEAATRHVWSEIAPENRTRPNVALHGAQAFYLSGLYEEARVVIEKALEKEWDERLLRPYRDAAALQGTQALVTQIERCEAWLPLHPGSFELEMTLGTLCFYQQLWGKAAHHLEQALQIAHNPDQKHTAHLKLAQMHETLNQPDQAAEHFRQCALANV